MAASCSLSKLSNNSWLGDDEDDDDPFAWMDPGWDEMDLEANIARDRHARLAEKVEELVCLLKTTEGEDKLSNVSEELVRQLPISASLDMLLTAGCFPARSLVGEQRNQRPHHQCPRAAAHPRDTGILHGQEPPASHLAAAQDRQCCQYFLRSGKKGQDKERPCPSR